MIAEKMMIDSMVGIMAGQGVNMKRSCRAAWIVTSYSHIAALRLLLCYLFQIICKEIYVRKLAG